MQALIELLRAREGWLIERIHAYAKEHGYTKYTSTLKEAWRQAVVGLTDSLCEGLARSERTPELSPDDNYESDPMTSFGVIEARRHRARGVSVGMFLGLMKYYRQSYNDMIAEAVQEPERAARYRLFLERAFDRIEIAFCQEWTGHDRDEALRELQTTNRRMILEKNAYLTVLESLADPVFLLDDRDEIVILNHAAARLLTCESMPGAHYYRPERDSTLEKRTQEVINRICGCGEQRYDLKQLPWLQTVLAELRDAPPAMILDREVRFENETRCFEIRYSKMLDFSEQFTGGILSLRDVTFRKSAEEERLRLESKFKEFQKYESLAALAGGVAHDFNNLLVGVLGHAELAKEMLPTESLAHALIEKVERAAHRAADLTRQMLAYAGKGGFDLARLDLSKLVRNMADLLRASVPKTATFCFELAETLPPIDADAAQIGQVVVNLVLNAVEALRDGRGNVVIRTGLIQADSDYLSTCHCTDIVSPGPHVTLEVSDDGCGMDSEVQGKIFDPFFSTKFTGRGLGLAAVHGIVRGHRGAIRVHSNHGQGAVFEVLFPAAPVPVSKQSREISPLQGEQKPKTILVVDDEEEVRSVTRMVLEREGYSVLTASDGLQGIDLFRLRGNQIDLVLLDMMMPGATGKEVLSEIRRLNNQVPVILSSGYEEHASHLRAVDQSDVQFIQKPYPIAQLTDSIERLLRQRTAYVVTESCDTLDCRHAPKRGIKEHTTLHP